MLRHIRLAVGTRRLRLPRIRGAKHVLTAVSLSIDNDVGLQRLFVDSILHISHRKHRPTVGTRIETPIQKNGKLIGITELSMFPRINQIVVLRRHLHIRRFVAQRCQRRIAACCKLAIHPNTGGIATWIVLVHHPIIVVAVHPQQSQLRLISTRHYERTHVVFLRIARNLL